MQKNDEIRHKIKINNKKQELRDKVVTILLIVFATLSIISLIYIIYR